LNPNARDVYMILIMEILTAELNLGTKEEARSWFNQMRQNLLDYNGSKWMSDEFKELEEAARRLLAEKLTVLTGAGS
jgi:V/A-type H+/Na+-transporting ATPase subunit A